MPDSPFSTMLFRELGAGKSPHSGSDQIRSLLATLAGLLEHQPSILFHQTPTKPDQQT